MTGEYQQAQSGAASISTPQAVPVPFGTYRLSPVRERLRRAGDQLPVNWVGRKLNSVFRDLCILGRAAPYDVEVFQGEYARLHPTDNRCEKRTLCGTQFWDREERTYLRQMIADVAGDTEFVFVDAGANVGLYTLYTRSVARCHTVSAVATVAAALIMLIHYTAPICSICPLLSPPQHNEARLGGEFTSHQRLSGLARERSQRTQC
ncbi:MAG: hypothetical protein JKY63_01015 [Rhodobiaceae bacterium]|nr:hypothetical protein [Rhodobiaceae bacterium]